MSKYIKTLHTVDLSHKPTVTEFLSFMHKNSAKIIMYKNYGFITNVLAIVTTHRNKEKK